jgi:hypothetical protein
MEHSHASQSDPVHRHLRSHNRARRAALAGLLGITVLAGCETSDDRSAAATKNPQLTRAVQPPPEVMFPQELRSKADRASSEGRKIVRQSISKLYDHNAIPNRRRDPVTGIVTWQNAVADIPGNSSRDDLFVTYDPRDGGMVTSESSYMVNGKRLRLTAVMLANGGLGEFPLIAEIRDATYLLAARRIRADDGGQEGGITVTYGLSSDPSSDVRAVDPYHGEWTSDDPIGREINISTSVRQQIANVS